MHEFIEFYGKNYIRNNQEVPCLHHIITLRRKTVGGLGVTELRKILGSPIIFLQRLGLLASNLECSWGLPRAIIKSHTEGRVGKRGSTICTECSLCRTFLAEKTVDAIIITTSCATVVHNIQSMQ